VVVVVVVVVDVVVVVGGLLISTADDDPMQGWCPELAEHVCQPREDVQPVFDVNEPFVRSSVPSRVSDADSTWAP